MSLFIPEDNVIQFPKMIVGPYEAHWKEDIPNTVYHADRDSISSSGVRHAVKSAARFRAYCAGELTEEETPAMKFGTLAHKCILEPNDFLSQYVVKPKFTGYTKDMKLTDSPLCQEVKEKTSAWLLEQAKHNKIITTAEEIEHLNGIARAIAGHDDARTALTNGKPELSGWYVDKETGLLCRIRPDFLHFNGKTLVDLKTTKDCESFSFSKDILSRGYHIQMAMYAAGCEAITGVKVKFPTLIAVEKKPPYEVAVYILDDAAMELGEAMYRRGLRAVKEALVSGKWPKYQAQAQNISLPAYAFWDDSAA
jgi:hypothetical protein